MKKIILITVVVIGLTGYTLDKRSDTLKDAFAGKFCIGVAVKRSQIHERKE
jgi:hypothetical protein